MSGRQGGKNKPLRAPKKHTKERDDEDVARREKAKESQKKFNERQAKSIQKGPRIFYRSRPQKEVQYTDEDIAREEYFLNAKNITRIDGGFKSILDQARQVAVYSFQNDSWQQTEAAGSLFLYERKTNPSHGIIVINRIGVKHFESLLHADEAEVEITPPFINVNDGVGIFCIWFYDQCECDNFAWLFEEIGCKISYGVPEDESESVPKVVGSQSEVLPDPRPRHSTPMATVGAGNNLLGMIQNADEDRRKRRDSPVCQVDPFKMFIDKINSGTFSLEGFGSNLSAGSGDPDSARIQDNTQLTDGSMLTAPPPAPVTAASSRRPQKARVVSATADNNLRARLYGPEATMQTVEQIERKNSPAVIVRPEQVAVPIAELAAPKVKPMTMLEEIEENKRLERLLKRQLGIAQRKDSDPSTASSDENNLSGSPSSAQVSSITPFLTPLNSSGLSRASSAASMNRNLYCDENQEPQQQRVSGYIPPAYAPYENQYVPPFDNQLPAYNQVPVPGYAYQLPPRRSLAALEAAGYAVIDNVLVNSVMDTDEVRNQHPPRLMMRQELVDFIKEKLEFDGRFVQGLYESYRTRIVNTPGYTGPGALHK